MKPEEARERLVQRLEVARQRRRKLKERDNCEHEWKKGKKSVPINNLKFKKFNAYFVALYCTKCKQVKLIHYVME